MAGNWGQERSDEGGAPCAGDERKRCCGSNGPACRDPDPAADEQSRHRFRQADAGALDESGRGPLPLSPRHLRAPLRRTPGAIAAAGAAPARVPRTAGLSDVRGYVTGTLWLDSSEEHARRQPPLGSLASPAARRPVGMERPSAAARCGGHGRRARGSHLGAPYSRRQSTCTSRPRRDLATGELLPDWYDDWVAIERERLRALRAHALEALCEQLTAAGQLGKRPRPNWPRSGTSRSTRALTERDRRPHRRGEPGRGLHQYGCSHAFCGRSWGSSHRCGWRSSFGR